MVRCLRQKQFLDTDQVRKLIINLEVKRLYPDLFKKDLKGNGPKLRS